MKFFHNASLGIIAFKILQQLNTNKKYESYGKLPVDSAIRCTIGAREVLEKLQ